MFKQINETKHNIYSFVYFTTVQIYSLWWYAQQVLQVSDTGTQETSIAVYNIDNWDLPGWQTSMSNDTQYWLL